MKPENLGLRIIQKYQPDATPSESDCGDNVIQCGSFRETFGKMTEDERNKMREARWMRDPQVNTWIHVP